MTLLRLSVRVVESTLDMITLRRSTLTLALICTFVVVAHIAYSTLTDLPLFGDGLLMFCYVILSYGWVSYLVVCCRDHVRATAAADRKVLMAEITSLRKTVNDIAYGEDARSHSREYDQVRDNRSRFDSIESKRN